jgi:hypothetical protein
MRVLLDTPLTANLQLACHPPVRGGEPAHYPLYTSSVGRWDRIMTETAVDQKHTPFFRTARPRFSPAHSLCTDPPTPPARRFALAPGILAFWHDGSRRD